MIDSLKKIWAEERFRIPAKIVASYALWKIFHHFASQRGTALNNFWLQFIADIGAVYARVTSFLLIPFVDHTHAEGIYIYLSTGQNYKAVLVEDHCLALPAMVVFTATVLFFRGRWQDKAWFIPLGLAGIVVINLIRLFFVSLAWLHLTAYFFDLHHSVIYVGISYGFIFLMIVWWIRRNRVQANADGAA